MAQKEKTFLQSTTIGCLWSISVWWSACPEYIKCELSTVCGYLWVSNLWILIFLVLYTMGPPSCLPCDPKPILFLLCGRKGIKVPSGICHFCKDCSLSNCIFVHPVSEKACIWHTYQFLLRCPACRHSEPHQHHPCNPRKAWRKNLVQCLQFAWQQNPTNWFDLLGWNGELYSHDFFLKIKESVYKWVNPHVWGVIPSGKRSITEVESI